MKRGPEQIGPEVLYAKPAEARTTRLKQRCYMRCSRRSAAAPLVLVLVLCIAGLAASCGADEDATLEIAGDLGTDIDNDDGEGFSGSDDSSQRQTDDPPEDTGPVELVRVPEVIGLSSDEALARLEAEGFDVGFAAHDVPEPGVEHDTVTGADSAPRTLMPYGSTVILDIYMDNSTGDEPVMTAEDWDRVRIVREIQAEFGDRAGRSFWDETTATLNVQIADLSTDDIDRLQARDTNEAFAVIFSAGTIGRGDLEALNRSTKDLVSAFFRECGVQVPRSIGINVESWSVFVRLSPDDAKGQSIDECISDMKQVVLANAADFAEVHSIPADPADLVRFREVQMQGPDSLYVPALDNSRD